MPDLPEPPPLSADERLAAEYALGLLDADDRMAARARIAADPAFARLVEDWEERAAPLLDELGDSEPSADMLDRIRVALPGTASEVVALRRQVRGWRWVAGGSAVAAALALALLVMPPTAPGPDDQPTTLAAADPLVSSIPIADTDLRLAVTYLPDRRELLVSASGLTADGVHDHELWVITDSSDALSLGVVSPGEERGVRLEPAVAQAIKAGAPIILTREPLGGKPADAAAGPVVAESTFTTI